MNINRTELILRYAYTSLQWVEVFKSENYFVCYWNKISKTRKNAIFEKNIGCAIQSQKQAKISTKTAKF